MAGGYVKRYRGGKASERRRFQPGPRILTATRRDNGLTAGNLQAAVIRRIKRMVLRTFLSDLILRRRLKKELRDWEKKGRLEPLPNLLKQQMVKEHARDFHLRTLVETGTCCGAVVSATEGDLARIISIEPAGLSMNGQERDSRGLSTSQ